MDEKPKAISGEIIPKDSQIPSEKWEDRPSVSFSIHHRLRAYVERKCFEASAAVEEAAARYENARLQRMENWEKSARQDARLTKENLEKISSIESNSILSELEESKVRHIRAATSIVAVTAEQEQQKTKNEVEDLKLQIELKQLREKLNPPPVSPKKKPDFEDYAEEILRTGATGSHQRKAEVVIAKFINDKGGEDKLTDEDRERIRLLRTEAVKRDESRG